MSHVAGLVEQIRPVTLQQFSNNEPRSLTDLAGFYYTLTPDLMRPDLWNWENDPAVPLLVAASACWNGRRLQAPSWPATATVRFCDSGGYVFGRRAGGFPFSIDDYHDWLTACSPMELPASICPVRWRLQPTMLR